MLKTKFKFIIYLLILCFLFSSASFATNELLMEEGSSDIAPINGEIDGEILPDDGTESSKDPEITQGDLFSTNFGTFRLFELLNGNVFVIANEFMMDVSQDGAVVDGDLFIIASTVTMTSTTIYSESSTDLDPEGNPVITSIPISSIVDGNLYVIANKVVIEPGCQISGAVFIIANDVEIKPHSNIYGNLFVKANNLKLKGLVGKDFYGIVSTFEMGFYGYINRDVHLTANNAILNGRLHKNSYITANKVITQKEFVNDGYLEINASKTIFLGEVVRKC